MKGKRFCAACEFETARLRVEEWHGCRSTSSARQDLAHIVAQILTEPVTRSLPEAWAGPYSVERARRWIAERDEGGTTLLVIERSTQETAGLVVLFEFESDLGVEVRLGYLLAERFWGKGLASELIAGLVRWCREQVDIHSIAGGVARDNPASKRVLEKAGFGADPADEGGTGEEILRIVLRAHSRGADAPDEIDDQEVDDG